MALISHIIHSHKHLVYLNALKSREVYRLLVAGRIGPFLVARCTCAVHQPDPRSRKTPCSRRRECAILGLRDRHVLPRYTPYSRSFLFFILILEVSPLKKSGFYCRLAPISSRNAQLIEYCHVRKCTKLMTLPLSR